MTHNNPPLPIIVAAHASDYEIGEVLLHKFPDSNQEAVVHVFRTLTKGEKKYNHIEKEGLALNFVVKKFHKMLQVHAVYLP